VIAGAVVAGISLYESPRQALLFNDPLSFKANLPYFTYEGSLNQYLSGSTNARLVGQVSSFSCCVSLYIFDNSTVKNWRANNFLSTNTSNSPLATVPSNEVQISPGAPQFQFSSVPTANYVLVLFNDNRSLWNSSTSASYQITLFLSLKYDNALFSDSLYAGALVMIVGLVTLFVSLVLVNRRQE
jgi:hypothetical protein